MSEKLVIIHQSHIREWASREDPPLPLATIQGVLARIDELIVSYDPEDVIIVEQLASTKFPILNDRVKKDDSVVLAGARAAYCLRLAREVLEGIGVKVKLDIRASLP